MKLDPTFVKRLRQGIYSQATERYETYVNYCKKRGEAPIPYEEYINTNQQLGFWFNANTWLEICNLLDIENKIEEPFTAEQKDSYLRRFVAETVGEVKERVQKHTTFRGYGKLAKLEEPSEKKPANIVVSQLENGNHVPSIDIDLPCKLVPSKTEGHYHLLIDKEMSWAEYQLLLNVLSIVGIVEDGYVKASIERGMSCIRLSPEEMLADAIQRKINVEDSVNIVTQDDPGCVVGGEEVKTIGDSGIFGLDYQPDLLIEGDICEPTPF